VNRRLAAAAQEYALPGMVLAGVWIAFATTTPLFRGVSSVYSVVEGFALLGLVAAGMAATVFAGELDLSVSSMAALAGVIAVRFGGMGLLGALVVATLAGVAFGAVQGGLIHRLGINSLVFTIGTLILLRGLAYVASGNKTTPLANLDASDSLLNRWEFVSPDSIVSLSVFALLWVLMSFTRPGRAVYALGGGRREAVAAGVPAGRLIVLVFAICGGCAALAGALASFKGGSASPDSFSNLLLNAPAAILIGGVSLQDGRGTVLNVLLGVAILSVVTAGLGDRGVQAYTVNLVVGCLLVIVVVAQFLLELRQGWADGNRARPAWAGVLTRAPAASATKAPV
jgi:ribose/xylose/arabinose/galactoside ABC-type transport system permease subunit